ncbi:Protein MOS2 [Hordeum vulgare]|nr:Protein MOS2 [Hordeum vulgare]
MTTATATETDAALNEGARAGARAGRPRPPFVAPPASPLGLPRPAQPPLRHVRRRHQAFAIGTTLIRKTVVRWLQSNIRIRVVNERFSKRLYLQKAKIVDVVGLTTCDIVMDDGSELVQGVERDMLETVLPRTNGRVLVLYGKHKGVYGHLVEKNSEAEPEVVEDADTKDMVRVKYDQIAEYVGDPKLLGH